MPVEASPEITDDAVLGGRLRLLQPRRGHRVGHDAILLAAASAVRDGDRVVDLGAGVGSAGLAVANRVLGARVTLIEIDAGLAALAAENVARNGFAGRVDTLVLDVAAGCETFDHAGLGAGTCDVVLMNPPFNDPDRHKTSPDPGRRSAHMAPPEGLVAWLATAARLLRAGGILTMIYRADKAAELLDALGRDFGDIKLMPVHPKPDAPAIRVLVGAVKASRAPLAILPGFVLADPNGTPNPAAEGALRHGGALPLETPR